MQTIIPSDSCILMVGLNHRTAPVRLRETLAFSEAAADTAIMDFKRQFPSSEAVIISTCNRVELYAVRHGSHRQ